ncbi:response regulator [Oryzifoliimicrobium ureilyticus]|uniref:response regulator n=1 Tax=Oryzifoliimicrobium ureilyticus TaxID=3113724 RepID=UPI003076487E
MLQRELEGYRLLVVEDEYFVASDLMRTLEDAGAHVYGPVSDVERAMEIVGGSFTLDGAILDINLNGEMIYPAAELLASRLIPFVFVTGYDRASVPRAFADTPYLGKPFDNERLVSVVASTVRRKAVS